MKNHTHFNAFNVRIGTIMNASLSLWDIFVMDVFYIKSVVGFVAVLIEYADCAGNIFAHVTDLPFRQ